MTTEKQQTETQALERVDAEAVYPLWRWHLWETGFGSYEEIEGALAEGGLKVFTCPKSDCDCKWPKVNLTTVPQSEPLPLKWNDSVRFCPECETPNEVEEKMAEQVQCADCWQWIDPNKNHTCKQQIARNRRQSERQKERNADREFNYSNSERHHSADC